MFAKEAFWNVFFDATELYTENDPAYVRKLSAPAAQTHLYVSELTIEERAVQLADALEELYGKMKRFQNLIKPQALMQRVALLEHFRQEIRARLKEDGVAVFAPRSHKADEQLALFMERTVGGYKDMMVLVSAIKFAAANNFKHCVFVTNDNRSAWQKAADALTRNADVQLTVIQSEAYRDFASITPDEFKQLTALFWPKLNEKAIQARDEFAKNAIANPFILATQGAAEIISFLKRSYEQDPQIVQARIHRSYVFCQPGAKTKPMPAQAHISVEFLVPRFTFGRYYDAYASGTVERKAGGFENPVVQTFDVSWLPTG